MSIAYELTINGPPEREDAAHSWLDHGPRPFWPALPGMLLLDLYTPSRARSEDPYVDDGHGPLLLLMLDFPDLATLDAALANPQVGATLKDLPAGLSATACAMERRAYPVGDATAPGPFLAPFSYVVRYARPAQDERAFVENYVASHPPTQRHLPAVRNIFCYLPLPWRDPHGLPDPDWMVGNEVAFDGPEAFNAAMKSPIRDELRAHYRAFPKFSGRVTHFPMDRARLEGDA